MIEIEKGGKTIIYHDEFYNEISGTEQWLRLSDGCFRNCWNCYCPTKKQFYEIPKIVRNKVEIIDMNFLWAYPEPLLTIKKLSQIKVNNKVVYYSFLSGLDFTLLTPDLCVALKKGRFGRFNNKRKFISGIRIAWDRTIGEQKYVKKAIDWLVKAGYKSKELQVFMLCNGKTPFDECVLKLELLKVWRVQVVDCWYDNQKRGSVKPIYWTKDSCEVFGKLCRRHNHMVEFRILPELKDSLGQMRL